MRLSIIAVVFFVLTSLTAPVLAGYEIDAETNLDILKQKLVDKPTHYEAFKALIEYYDSSYKWSEERQVQAREELKSLVMHGSKYLPDTQYMGEVLNYKMFRLKRDAPFMASLNAQWEKNAEQFSSDIFVISNVAILWESQERYAEAIMVFETLHNMQPMEMLWVRKLQSLHQRVAYRSSSDVDAQPHYKAGFHYTKLLVAHYEDKKEDQLASFARCDLPHLSFELKMTDEAEEYANQCLETEKLWRSYSDYVDALFVLAKVNYERGNIVAVQEQLMKVPNRDYQNLSSIEEMLRQYQAWNLVKTVDRFLLAMEPKIHKSEYQKLQKMVNNYEQEQREAVDNVKVKKLLKAIVKVKRK